MATSLPFQPGQILENRLPNGRVIVVKVIEFHFTGEYRVADVRDCTFNRTDAYLIRNNLTWACPIENLFPHDADCGICHKDGLVIFA